ncbi:unnamed protein product [Withania somnifera]
MERFSEIQRGLMYSLACHSLELVDRQSTVIGTCERKGERKRAGGNSTRSPVGVGGQCSGLQWRVDGLDGNFPP